MIEIKNFKSQEFCCKCGCGLCDVDPKLVEMLQIIRNYWGKPIRITSARRCSKHNKNVGGVQEDPNRPGSGSKHLHGLAADITTDSRASIFYEFIVKLYKEGKIPNLGYIQLYRMKNFVHVDVRPEKSNIIRSFEKRSPNA